MDGFAAALLQKHAVIPRHLQLVPTGTLTGPSGYTLHDIFRVGRTGWGEGLCDHSEVVVKRLQVSRVFCKRSSLCVGGVLEGPEGPEYPATVYTGFKLIGLHR